MHETQERQVWSLGGEDPLEKGMATPSSIHAWRIPCTEEPGRLQSMGPPRVGHDWAQATKANIFHSLASEMCREFENKATLKPVILTPEPHLDLLYTSWDLGYTLVFIFKIDLLSTPEMGENPQGQFASAVSERKAVELIMWANTKVMPG